MQIPGQIQIAGNAKNVTLLVLLALIIQNIIALLAILINFFIIMHVSHHVQQSIIVF